MTTTHRRRGPVPGAPRAEPWKPVPYEIADVGAVQAVAFGRASEDQQRRAFDFIVKTVCGCADLAYRPGGLEGDRDTAFACGRQFVGLQLDKFKHMNLSALRGRATEQGAPPKPTTETPT